MQLTSINNVNALSWITSLKPEEEGFARRAAEDLHTLAANTGVKYDHVLPASVSEVRAYLTRVADAAAQGLRPIIHFDTHGSKTNGLWIAASHEFVSWDELANLLRPINLATRGQLCVVSAACFGFQAIKEVRIQECAPFHMLIAPEEKVSFSFVEERALAFYEAALKGLDITLAYEFHLKPRFRMFHSERMLAIAIARYIQHACRGSAGALRRERLVTEVLDAGVPRNRATIRALRRSVSQMTRPTQALVDRYADNFLGGRKPGFDMEGLKRLVDQILVAEDRARAVKRRKVKSGLRR